MRGIVAGPPHTTIGSFDVTTAHRARRRVSSALPCASRSENQLSSKTSSQLIAVEGLVVVAAVLAAALAEVKAAEAVLWLTNAISKSLIAWELLSSSTGGSGPS